jgi:hypothetical protein
VTQPAALVHEHVAIGAWRRAGGPRPAAVESIGSGRSRKSVLLRFVGAGRGGGSVVAKLCRSETGRLERRIYEDLLPRLPIAAPRFYGSTEEPEGVWLFLEDLGPRRFDPSDAEHRVLAARWLAGLHASAARIGLADLPERGAAHYLEHLRAGRSTILENLENPAFGARDPALLESVVAQCNALEMRWGEIEEFCALLPQTLVHGDFHVKNIHVRAGAGGLELFPIDWEMAGRGVPAIDLWPLRREPKLPLPDLAVYGAAMREHWPDLDRRLLRRLVALGRVFRNLAAIDWASVNLPSPWPEKPLSQLRIYRDELRASLRETRWAA